MTKSTSQTTAVNSCLISSGTRLSSAILEMSQLPCGSLLPSALVISLTFLGADTDGVFGSLDYRPMAVGFPQSIPPLKPSRISTIPAERLCQVPLSLDLLSVTALTPHVEIPAQGLFFVKWSRLSSCRTRTMLCPA